MNTRPWFTLLGIAGIVAVLGLWRGGAAPIAATEDAAPAVSLPSILDFGRGECVACKKMMPVLDALRELHAGVVDVRYFDLKEPANAARASELKVRLIPTQVFVAADGREMFRHEGFFALDDVERKLAELGWTSSR